MRATTRKWAIRSFGSTASTIHATGHSPAASRLSSRPRTQMRHTIPVLALLLVGCQDLTVENRNLPDRDRATQQPTATEAFVAGAFRTWWPVAGHDDYPAWAFSTMAREMTSGFTDFGQLEVSAEPREQWNNSPFSARFQVN